MSELDEIMEGKHEIKHLRIEGDTIAFETELNNHTWNLTSRDIEIIIYCLQQENKQLKEKLENKIDLYEDTISYQLGFEKGKEGIKKEILEFVNNLKGGDKEEFMGYGGYELLEIIGEKENE